MLFMKWWKRLTNWESWPFKLLYAPLVPFWIGYMLRSRSVWFFTPSNPKITFGGMDGESKSEIYELMRKEWYPKTIYIEPGESLDAIQNRMRSSEISFPFVVKPDVACQGILFRKIDHVQQLSDYHAASPARYLIQELVVYPMEVSVFHIRHPKSSKGMVTGFLHKIPMQILGDGMHTIRQLIEQHPKASKRMDEMKSKHEIHWNKVLSKGEVYMLSHAGNHNRGARFVDLKDEIDEELTSIFDRISNEVGDFYYGRYDIMCQSVADLKQGKNFTILEYNGCGAEPNHFYDTGYTLLGAYREILKHWKWLYIISSYNAKHGTPYWSYTTGKSFMKKIAEHYKILRDADVKLG